MMIRIEKPLLEAMQLFKAVPKAEWRAQLTGIMFDADGTVWAANGHVALIARDVVKPDKNYVLSIDKTPAAGKKYHTAVIDTVGCVCHYVPEFPEISTSTDDELISRAIAVSKVEHVTVNRVVALANPIPPEVKPVSQIVFDSDYLALLPKVADLFEKQEGGKFTFALTGDNTASLVKIRAGQNFKLTVILMPIVV